MERGEHSFIEPIGNVELRRPRFEISTVWGKIVEKLEYLFIQRGLALLIVGFLLGRALILSQLAPFALPFFAAVFVVRRKKAPLVLLGLLAGSLTISFGNGALIFTLCLLFLTIFRFTERFHQYPLKVLPFYVFFLSFFTKVAFTYIGSGQKIMNYDFLMAGVEASLALVLVFIFMQGIPLLTSATRKKIFKDRGSY